MPSPRYVPHVNLLLQSLRIAPERLRSRSKIAIDTELLRALLQLVVEGMPFSAEFYRETYPDVASAGDEGAVTDLMRHMVEQGYLEGRIGAPPEVDEEFYLDAYPDVREAVERGDVASGTDHYIRAGAAEGRVPHPDLRDVVNHWHALLQPGRV